MSQEAAAENPASTEEETSQESSAPENNAAGDASAETAADGALPSEEGGEPAPGGDVVNMQAFKARKKFASLKRLQIQVEIVGKDEKKPQTYVGRMFLCELMNRDFSPLGLRFSLTEKIEQGTIIKIHAGDDLTIEGRLLWCAEAPEANGRIISQNNYGYRAEAQLLISDTQSREQLVEYIKELMRRFF